MIGIQDRPHLQLFFDNQLGQKLPPACAALSFPTIHDLPWNGTFHLCGLAELKCSCSMRRDLQALNSAPSGNSYQSEHVLEIPRYRFHRDLPPAPHLDIPLLTNDTLCAVHMHNRLYFDFSRGLKLPANRANAPSSRSAADNQTHMLVSIRRTCACGVVWRGRTGVEEGGGEVVRRDKWKYASFRRADATFMQEDWGDTVSQPLPEIGAGERCDIRKR